MIGVLAKPPHHFYFKNSSSVIEKGKVYVFNTEASRSNIELVKGFSSAAKVDVG
jgi:hypothetical protein